jgi:hypothetical protein
MPGMNRTGPEGLGPMTGRGMGFCGGGCGVAPGYGRGLGRGMRNGYGPAEGAGNGRGRGFGPGMGRSTGPGRGLGWFSAGYSGAGYSGAGYSEPVADTATDIKNALENRAGFLRAELARTEAMLGAAPGNQSTQKSDDSNGDEGK